MSLLVVENLHALVEDKEILKGVNLAVGAGEMHVVMGQNGSGKSTLAHVVAGNPNFAVSLGKMTYDGVDLASLSPAERAKRGIFISFQNPIDLPGVRVMSFLQSAVNASRAGRGAAELSPADFLRLVRETAAGLNISEEMLRREMNVGFSGGERKRFEALQMLLLEPKLILLDEIDSGLDRDALGSVVQAIQTLFAKGASVVLITHYYGFLNRLAPNFVHLIADGRIVKSGGIELAAAVEQGGYEAQVGG